MPAHLIVEEGSLSGRIFHLEEGDEWILGRDPDSAQFVIEDSTVSRKHLLLTRTPEGILLKNLSMVNPVLVNEEEVGDHPTLLKEGDRIQVGHQSLVFSEGAPPAAKKKKTSKKESYDDIFGELEEPPPPPREEPKEIEREITRDRPTEVIGQTREETPYDTIFEDAEGGEELPFNLFSPAALLLKVIAGPNAGAEIGIEKGHTYTIGKDSNSCDIVFQDLSVSRTHARLSVSAEGVLELEDLGSKNRTLINGTPCLEKRTITPQDLIALGTTVFVVIDRDAPQETIYSPSLSMYETPKTDQPPPEESAAASQTPELDWKERPLPSKHLVMAGSFLAIFLIVFLSFFSLFKAEKLEVAHSEPVDKIQEAIAKFKDVQFSFNPGSSKLFLVGHVLTGIEYQELSYQIEQLPWVQSVENNVVIDELVAKMSNDIISQTESWRAVSIQSVAPGKFAAMGYLQTNEQAVQLWEYLTVNFPYLDRLQNQLVVEENLNTQVQSLFAKAGFGAVTLQLSHGDLVLAGRYSEKAEKQYRELLGQLNKLPGIARVNDYAMAVSADMAGIDITQQYQVGGSSFQDGRGYSVVLNGKVYTVGDAVDGMKIANIESKMIVLEKDGLNYRIDYTAR